MPMAFTLLVFEASGVFAVALALVGVLSLTGLSLAVGVGELAVFWASTGLVAAGLLAVFGADWASTAACYALLAGKLGWVVTIFS